MAEFSADSSRLRIYTGHRQELFNRVMEMKWKINGKEFYFGSSPVQVVPNPDKLDTLFYKRNEQAEWDTIICNVTLSEKYQFVYNTCCDGFNVRNLSTDKFIEGRVIIKMSNYQKDKVFLCTLGEAGMIPKNGVVDTLETACRSAMSPNIYELTFKEINICLDTTNCQEGTCLIRSKNEEPEYDFGYKTISTKLDVLFMPLGNGILKLSYDLKKNELIIK